MIKINYPTGGHTQFVYENNAEGRYPTIDEIALFDGTPTPYYAITGSGFNTADSLSEYFSVPNYVLIDFKLHYFLEFTETPDYHHYGIVKIFDDSNPDIPLFESDHLTSTTELVIPIEELDHKNGLTIKMYAYGSRTTLRCRLICKKYDPLLLEIKREFLKGGLRIHQLINYDQVSGETTFKTYDYDKSGYLSIEGTPLYYTETTDRRVDPSNNQHNDYQRVLFYSSPVGGLGNSANSVSYEKVIEYFGTSESNYGKTITTYWKYTDLPSSGTPYLPQLSYQFLRSKVLKDEYYRFISETDYELIKQIEYQYGLDTLHLYIIRGFKASRILTVQPSIHYTYDYPDEFRFSNFQIATYNYRLAHMITHDFYNNGGDILTTQDYYYDNPHHLNPTRIISNSSTGKTLKTILKYPLDYVNVVYTCDEDYESNLNDCTDDYVQWSTELGECLVLYGSCYDQLLHDLEAAVDCYWNNGLTHYGFGFLSKKCRGQTVSNAWNDFGNCLSSSGYSSCLESLACGYIPCQIEANKTYNNCILNYYSSIINLYETATDPDLKGIYLMALCDFHNTLVEKIEYVDEIETRHYKFSFNKYINHDKPILVKAEEEVNGEGFITKMVYDKYDDYLNILQEFTYDSTASNSYIWGYNNDKYLIAETKNATYKECGYTGFENNESNTFQVNPNCGTIEYGEGFTGNYSIRVTECGPSSYFKVGVSAQQRCGYRASVWVKGSNTAFIRIQVGDEWNTQRDMFNTNPEGEWHLLEVDLPKFVLEEYFSLGENLRIKVYIGSNGEAYFDDLRFYPIDSQMTTYTHKPLVGITSSSDMNNKPTYYQYDVIDRLFIVSDFQGNIIRKYDYHIKE